MKGKKVLVHVQKIFYKTIKPYSFWSSVGVLYLKGFRPIYIYIYTYKSIHIHIYTPPRPKYRRVALQQKRPPLFGLKRSRKSSGIGHRIENHGFLPTSFKILYYRKNYFLSLSHFRHQLKIVFRKK